MLRRPHGSWGAPCGRRSGPPSLHRVFPAFDGTPQGPLAHALSGGPSPAGQHRRSVADAQRPLGTGWVRCLCPLLPAWHGRHLKPVYSRLANPQRALLARQVGVQCRPRVGHRLTCTEAHAPEGLVGPWEQTQVVGCFTEDAPKAGSWSRPIGTHDTASGDGARPSPPLPSPPLGAAGTLAACPHGGALGGNPQRLPRVSAEPTRLHGHLQVDAAWPSALWSVRCPARCAAATGQGVGAWPITLSTHAVGTQDHFKKMFFFF